MSQTSTGVTTTTDTTTSNNNTSTTTTSDTTKNVKKNDPEKNKKLAEINIAEQLRDTIKTFKIRIPRILRGLHTNQFLFLPVSDDFYEKNYPEIMEIIANKKFGRYAGFQKNRFFIDKVETYGGSDEWGQEITLNPIASNYGEYMKMQQEAEKAIIQAVNTDKIESTSLNTASGANITSSTSSDTSTTSTTTTTSTSSDGTSVGLVTLSGNDCTDTFSISARTFDINKTPQKIIGNSSANYAQDTAHMSAKEAILNLYTRFSYSSYSNNRTCPRKMWRKTGRIYGNCADAARLTKALGEVHGLKVGIRHAPNHYYNLIQLNGKTYRFDCCFSYRGYSTSAYGGELVNNLTKNGGPWA